jgi:hypothetical protein
VTARIIGYKEERLRGGIDTDKLQVPTDRLVPGRTRLGAPGDPAARAAHQWKGYRDDEIKLIYQRSDPHHPKIAHRSLLWLVPIFPFTPAILLLIALGWLILVSKLPG